MRSFLNPVLIAFGLLGVRTTRICQAGTASVARAIYAVRGGRCHPRDEPRSEVGQNRSRHAPERVRIAPSSRQFSDIISAFLHRGAGGPRERRGRHRLGPRTAEMRPAINELLCLPTTDCCRTGDQTPRRHVRRRRRQHRQQSFAGRRRCRARQHNSVPRSGGNPRHRERYDRDAGSSALGRHHCDSRLSHRFRHARCARSRAVRRHVARAVAEYGDVVVTMHLGAEGPTRSALAMPWSASSDATRKSRRLRDAAFAGGATFVDRARPARAARGRVARRQAGARFPWATCSPTGRSSCETRPTAVLSLASRSIRRATCRRQSFARRCSCGPVCSSPIRASELGRSSIH